MAWNQIQVKEFRIRNSGSTFHNDDQFVRDFLLLVFWWISFPQPQSILLGPFQIFSKIRGDICKSRCTTNINDTGDKIATGVNEASGK